MSLLASYAEYVAQSQDQALSPGLERAVRRVVLDWTGALLAGSQMEAATRLIDAFSDEAGGGHCRVAGSAQTYRARAAAFLNGTISHVAEFDDIFRDGVYHPACPTVSAVWALAEQTQASPESFWRAVVAGYEVSTRIARALQPSHYTYFHTTGTVGVLGAAAACASLLRLNAQEACHAMAMAGTFASGLQQAFRSDSMTKPVHAGHAAEVGVHAALMARCGMTGAPDLLEGDVGLGAAMSDGADWSRALDGLGQDFLITQMTFKNHGCCGHNFAAIDGLAALMRTHGLKADDIERVQVGGYRATIEVCAYRHPVSPFEAKFSLSHTLACQALLGSVREKAFAPEALGRADLQAFERRVQAAVDADCAAAFPGRRSARVTLTLRDGRVLSQWQSTRHGDPDDPLTDDELADKFFELASPRIGPDPARALSASLLGERPDTLKHWSQHWSQPAPVRA